MNTCEACPPPVLSEKQTGRTRDGARPACELLPPQALVLTFFTLAAAVLRLLYATRRRRFCVLLLCWPIVLYFETLFRLLGSNYEESF